MNKSPLVSICIPTYNAELFLRDAVKSAFGQSYQNTEVIVVDDCSSDNTMSLLNSLKKEYPSLIVKQNSKNQGLVGNWNICIDLAQGEYVCLLHMDDMYKSGMLEKQMKCFQHHPELGAVFTLHESFNIQNRITGRTRLPQSLQKDTIDSIDILLELMEGGNDFLTCPSALMRKDIFQTTGLFDTAYIQAVDIEMWLRISSHFPVLIINEPLMYYRVSDIQATARYHRLRTVETDLHIIMRDYIEKNAKKISQIDKRIWEKKVQNFNLMQLKDDFRILKNAILKKEHQRVLELIEHINETVDALSISPQIERLLEKNKKYLTPGKHWGLKISFRLQNILLWIKGRLVSIKNIIRKKALI